MKKNNHKLLGGALAVVWTCLNAGGVIGAEQREAQRPDLAEVGDVAVQNDLPQEKSPPNYSTLGLARPDSQPQTAEGPIVYSVTLNDPGSAYSAYYAAITSNLQAAGAEWERYVIGSGNLEVEVVITSSVPRITGASVTSGFVRNDGTRDIFEQGAAYEIRTGIDPNGATPDIRIYINPTYLTSNMWFDPNPTERTDPIPPNRTDAISLFSHELGHAFVFNGWMNGTTGELPPTYMSPFDANVHFDGNNFYFVGPDAGAWYGGPVAITYGNPFHLGNDPPRPGSDLISDLMNGVVYYYQTRYRISPLDLEIAKDCGVAIDTQSIQMQLTAAASRKMHGGLGPFDIPLPLTGAPGVECRSSAGNHTLVFTFTNEVVSGDADVTTGVGSVSGSPIFFANTMAVTLTGVADMQQIAVTLSNVTDSFSQVLPDTAVSVNVLVGDTTGNKAVNSTDVSQTKLQSGVVVSQANCRQDVTANGVINSSDVSLVKLRSGSAIP